MLDASAEQVRGVIEEAARISTMLSEAPPVPRADLFRELVERIVIEDCSISITVRRRPLLAGVEGTLGEDQGHSMVLLAPVEFRRRGVETKLVLPDTPEPKKPFCLDRL